MTEPSQTSATSCLFCQATLSAEIIRTPRWVIVDAQEPWFPGFTRVIWTEHVREMTDLSYQERQALMGVVFEVEHVMRQTLKPHKVNLASLGNQTPHLHWHVIPRFEDDAVFPAPVWVTGADTPDAQRQRERTLGALAHYHETLIQRFTCQLP